ncbi:unnamed protein product [Mytilus edulis]|uniref:Uncharacterized protein n=1 Tax=Mytilus edulis TaxID=6550 RepID=A0A8S3SKL0_MYTED|nr:unnamed protein product [Mytilus edulis]
MDLAKDVEQVTHEVFNRYLFSKTFCNSTEKNLQVFVDASTKAYGAAAYLCNGSDSTLVMAKTRVAPLKELTLPQLELMAPITLWSDSQIVLHWLKSTKTLKRFITNRVNEINDLTYSHIWKYCPTDCNPADLLTRGITSEKYKESTLWKKGPSWLTDTSKFPNTTIVSDAPLSVLINDQENSQATRDISTDKNENQPGIHVIMEINRYGSYKRLLRVTAYVQHFVSKCHKQRNSRQTGQWKPLEIQKSAELWIKHCPETSFPEEYKALKSKTTTNLARIRQLRLFLDDNNLMRCQGRIHNAPISEFAKFPYILPSNHALSELIIIDAHRQVLHSGCNMTITHIRQTFWIPAIRQVTLVQLHTETVYICNHHELSLVIAKNRVAPLKQLTLLHIELMAALIGARLADHVKSVLHIEEITFSDSQIVLQWLSTSKQLKRFIRNRVTEIRKLTSTQEWRYCPTKDNLADLLN